MSERIGKISIGDLKGKVFVIPFYQRGYRWTENEARKLFSDLLDFTSSKEPEYCLQPIVLHSIQKQDCREGLPQDFDCNEYLLVIDGQQRLTTIAILLDALGVEREWEIYYKAEKNTLSELSRNNDTKNQPINYYFRKKVREAFDSFLDDRKDVIRGLLNNPQKSIVFLRYDISPEVKKDEKEGYEGHNAFLRLNAGKTPLTSSELIRALYMVNASGLSLQERMEISKEWEIIENTLCDEQFWLMFNSEGLSKTPTRIDLLFALVKDVSLREAKANPRIVFEKMDAAENGKDLRTTWFSVLRCFWWMQSCYADVELFNCLCWIREFTENSAKTIYDKWRSYPKMEDFKVSIIEIIQKRYEGKEFNNFDCNCNKNELRALFVLLNLLDCNKSKERFRFDLYQKDSWDIEHIDSRTPNDLTKTEDQREWLFNSYNELSEDKRTKFKKEYTSFDERNIIFQSSDDFAKMAKRIVELFNDNEEISNENALGNLALLNASINRAYKNAIFPLKRKTIKNYIINGDHYVPPCTAKAFMKFYTESPSKITNWLQVDFNNYSKQMSEYFEDFMKISLSLPEPRGLEKETGRGNTINNKHETYSIPSNVFHSQCKSINDANNEKQERFFEAVSFPNFMKKYNVVIPKIQRLYVQGRLDSKNLSGFAYHLVDCVSNNKDCPLDFVYGIDEKCGKTMTFYPLDGQQRLTTLLLLAWLCGENKDKQWVFRYDSRRTTECFINGLLSHDPPCLVMPDNYEQQKEKYKKKNHKGYLPLCSDSIKKSDWFLITWQNDAGIAGMLEMLDSLYCKLLDTKKQGFDLGKVTFFVNYLDAGSDSYDQIFLKMNSRGKPLTEWENVKAVLDMNATEKAIKDGWQEKLDNTWQEDLWNKLDKNEDRINKLDTKMLSVVELALSCVGYDESTKNNTFMLSNWLEQKENTEKKNEFYDICDKFFSAINVVDDQNVLIPIWNGNNEIVPDFTAENDSDNCFYKPLLVYYAGRGSTNCDWMRVVWNLAENAGIDRSNFRYAYMLIKELSQHANDILDFLAGDENINRIESQFAKAQIAEERLKARLIQIDELWKNRIMYAESLPFIKGRVQVLLDASKSVDGYSVDVFNTVLDFCNKKFPNLEDEKQGIWENSYKEYFVHAIEKDLPFNCKNPFSYETVKENFFTTVKIGVKEWLKSSLVSNIQSPLVTMSCNSQENKWNNNLLEHWAELAPLNGTRNCINVYRHGWGNNLVFVFNKSDIRGANLISPSCRQELITVLKNQLNFDVEKKWDLKAYNFDTLEFEFQSHKLRFIHSPDDYLQMTFDNSIETVKLVNNSVGNIVSGFISKNLNKRLSNIQGE